MAGFFGACAGRADDGHMRQRGVQCVDFCPAQAQFFQSRWPERGKQHIGFIQLAVQQLLARIGFQIGVEYLDAFVQLRVGARVVQPHGVARGRLKFDAGRPHLAAAHQGGRTGQVERQAQDALALESLRNSRFGKGLGHGVVAGAVR